MCTIFTRKRLAFWLHMATWALLLWALYGALRAFFDRIGYELLGPLTYDSPIYLAIGRGILNGLTPYVDLFETKPPGMFVLSSLSFLLTDSPDLLRFFQIGVLLLIPAVCALGALQLQYRVSRVSRLMMTTCAIAVGILLSLYTAERSGEFQVESFGALFGCAYAALIAMDPRPLGWKRQLSCGIVLAVSIGFKEPFFLSCVAAALILAHHPRDLLRSVGMPSLIAGFIGIAALWYTGMLEGYLHVYLPEMFGNHVATGASPWVRGTWLGILHGDLHAYQPSFAYGVAAALIGAIALRLHVHRHPAAHGNTLLSFGLATYMVMLSVAMGGHFFNHHFAFAVPGIAALFLLCMRDLQRDWVRLRSKVGAVVMAGMVMVMSTQVPDAPYEGRLAIIEKEMEHAAYTAEIVDEILDDCGIDRYLFLGGNGTFQLYGLTRHSPIGPLFLQYDEWMSLDRTRFRADLLRAVSASTFVVYHRLQLGSLTPLVQWELDTHFTTAPWRCAGEIPSDHEYTFLFRKSQ